MPLAVEGTLCCYAQWCEALGKSTEVSTPILDTIVGAFQFCHEWCVDRIAPSFNSVLRDPKIAIPVSSLLIVMAIALLRPLSRIWQFREGGLLPSRVPMPARQEPRPSRRFPRHGERQRG